MIFYALAPKLPHERDRQAAVDRHGVAEKRSPVLEALVERAAKLFGATIGIATVIDHQRMIVSAKHGTKMGDINRDISFCGHAIARPDEVMCVLDATQDKRFAGNPLVQNDPSIRFYIGAPLVEPDGQVLGALCAIDTRPRAALDPEQAEQLRALAALATEELLR
ncbi:GAF domain-containing protein [Sphingomonas sp. MMS12-HWE2-04]|uniref:GAF domain-containing protein n=1 Tax=Sphingomonas sp. MMS12-HWE2-04 TaxID=3234199 RepID=UPI00384E017D